jgi:hypothetical protein
MTTKKNEELKEKARVKEIEAADFKEQLEKVLLWLCHHNTSKAMVQLAANHNSISSLQELVDMLRNRNSLLNEQNEELGVHLTEARATIDALKVKTPAIPEPILEEKTEVCLYTLCH